MFEEEMSEKDVLKEKKRLDRIIYCISEQMSPLLDRLGRLLMDIGPHFAMYSNNTRVETRGNQHSIRLSSLLENDDDHHLSYPINAVNEDPSTQAYDTVIHNYIDSLRSIAPRPANTNTLSSRGRNIRFEVPVMLNPGELLATTSRQSHQLTDEPVHLHISANVQLPRLDLETNSRPEEASHYTHQGMQTSN